MQKILNVETPGYIYGDNETSIFFAMNNQVSNGKNYIDIREQFIK